MANLKTDSPISRRIARSFLQFLNSVEPSAGVDGEALEVARECLAEDLGMNAEVSDGTQSTDQGKTREPHSLGKDELFGHFFYALEKIHYFRRMPDGNDDQMQLDRATNLFRNAVQIIMVTGNGNGRM